MRLLLHACCGPCAVGCVDSLRGEGVEPTLYWYNPNIRPEGEHGARLGSLSVYAGIARAEVIVVGGYDPDAYAAAALSGAADRCAACYYLRMEAAARAASEGGFDAFSTTLLISPYQDAQKIIEAGERSAEAHGVAFLARDFRPLYREGRRRAREMGLYMQKYCGCGL